MKVKKCNHSSHNHSCDIEQLLRSNGARVTSPRTKILSVLAGSNIPLSCDEVFSSIKGEVIDLVTIYRSMAKFEELGIVRKSDFGDEIRRFELASEEHHHHYVRCRDCGVVEPFDGCSFDESMRKFLIKKGYKNITHKIEVIGVCSKCA